MFLQESASRWQGQAQGWVAAYFYPWFMSLSLWAYNNICHFIPLCTRMCTSCQRTWSEWHCKALQRRCNMETYGVVKNNLTMHEDWWFCVNKVMDLFWKNFTTICFISFVYFLLSNKRIFKTNMHLYKYSLHLYLHNAYNINVHFNIFTTSYLRAHV